jgi:hypothetical protein
METEVSPENSKARSPIPITPLPSETSLREEQEEKA